MHLSLAATRMRPPAARTHATHAGTPPPLPLQRRRRRRDVPSRAYVHTHARMRARICIRGDSLIPLSYRLCIHECSTRITRIVASSLARMVFFSPPASLRVRIYLCVKEYASRKRANARVREGGQHEEDHTPSSALFRSIEEKEVRIPFFFFFLFKNIFRLRFNDKHSCNKMPRAIRPDIESFYRNAPFTLILL